ncbi:uncharacterized protein NCU06981 [Neurospora crassa OR74A]|uniref:WSC domain-containing protein n=1 Tax=Neurospora crassa (strain ATCC 24698 / 74-OR23-1A / CBS 708.71 / DSM 1257 / FGSC 987) TaxID=367110 RepID=V5IMW5_NEUCR|nr:uncharacterized protein NCU06981 [Neurospora crassa OR74A]ESA43037.1 hypothetical protein, variant [Neurospora crassa OR74A]|eukprot:XP_011394210.1 uncharacterized protein NCU06981 [Neurospora crassa OR74A]
MARQRAARLWACLALVASLCGNALAVGPSHDVAYCATVNTADPGMDANESDYQSMGLCYGTCSSAAEKYAFAVVWQKSCWCTNVVPNSANTVSSKQCSNPCPGYPSDWCGGDSLYGYLKITGIKPSSTAAPASSTSTGTTTQQATKTTTSSTKPTTQPTTTATQTTDDPVTTDPMQPSTQTVTVGGKVQTVIITPTPTATSAGQLAEPEANGKKKAISTGAAVGIALGVVAALGIIGVLLWIWFMKRRKQNEESGSSFGSPRGSSSGSKGATVTETRFAPELVAWGDGPASKRRSTLMPVDPRLNPYGSALYNGQNKSRESIASFQDNQDYSRRVVGQPRVLRAVNPDPIAED